MKGKDESVGGRFSTVWFKVKDKRTENRRGTANGVD